MKFNPYQQMHHKVLFESPKKTLWTLYRRLKTPSGFVDEPVSGYENKPYAMCKHGKKTLGLINNYTKFVIK